MNNYNNVEGSWFVLSTNRLCFSAQTSLGIDTREHGMKRRRTSIRMREMAQKEKKNRMFEIAIHIYT